jgi:myo-inositol 2-dehydrogenase/D-chiro-inositol 1-dehydrogenase
MTAKEPNNQQTLRESRRCFLKSMTAASVAGPALLSIPPITRAAHVSGSDILRVGLIGCGGRGTGATQQALNADPQTKLTALGDAFENRLTTSLETPAIALPGKTALR